MFGPATVLDTELRVVREAEKQVAIGADGATDVEVIPVVGRRRLSEVDPSIASWRQLRRREQHLVGVCDTPRMIPRPADVVVVSICAICCNREIRRNRIECSRCRTKPESTDGGCTWVSAERSNRSGRARDDAFDSKCSFITSSTSRPWSW